MHYVTSSVIASPRALSLNSIMHWEVFSKYYLIIHEMLRKKAKATQHNRKTKQHNTTCPMYMYILPHSAYAKLGTYTVHVQHGVDTRIFKLHEIRARILQLLMTSLGS